LYALDPGLMVSTDDGVTWKTLSLPDSNYMVGGMAMSQNGSVIAVIPDHQWSIGYPYVSQDGGKTWVQQTAAGSSSWGSLGMSADGTKIYAAKFDTPTLMIGTLSPSKSAASSSTVPDSQLASVITALQSLLQSLTLESH
jgi:hypothetical protein